MQAITKTKMAHVWGSEASRVTWYRLQKLKVFRNCIKMVALVAHQWVIKPHKWFLMINVKPGIGQKCSRSMKIITIIQMVCLIFVCICKLNILYIVWYHVTNWYYVSTARVKLHNITKNGSQTHRPNKTLLWSWPPLRW